MKIALIALAFGALACSNGPTKIDATSYEAPEVDESADDGDELAVDLLTTLDGSAERALAAGDVTSEAATEDDEETDGEGEGDDESLFARIDTDKDGKISRAERRAARRAVGKKADTNGDGKVDVSEREAAYDKLKGRLEKLKEKNPEKAALLVTAACKKLKKRAAKLEEKGEKEPGPVLKKALADCEARRS